MLGFPLPSSWRPAVGIVLREHSHLGPKIPRDASPLPGTFLRFPERNGLKGTGCAWEHSTRRDSCGDPSRSPVLVAGRGATARHLAPASPPEPPGTPGQPSRQGRGQPGGTRHRSQLRNEKAANSPPLHRVAEKPGLPQYQSPGTSPPLWAPHKSAHQPHTQPSSPPPWAPHPQPWAGSLLEDGEVLQAGAGRERPEAAGVGGSGSWDRSRTGTRGREGWRDPHRAARANGRAEGLPGLGQLCWARAAQP